MTGFGDNANGRYRVKVTQPTEFGPVIGIYEKNAELGANNPVYPGNSNIKDSEDDDGMPITWPWSPNWAASTSIR